MKNLSLRALIFSALSFATLPAYAGGDCNMAVTYSEMAYKQFKKAYTSTNSEEMQKLIKKGIEDANLAAAYSIQSQCNCGGAKNYALDAVVYGQKALKEPDHNKQLKLIKTAMDTSIDLLAAVNGCK